VGRLSHSLGFERYVAIKRAHPHLVENPRFRAHLIREAQVASKIHHANVVAVNDVEELGPELLLIMDYVEGASAAELIASGTHDARPLPGSVVLRILLDACAGLAAVHELKDEKGVPLRLVHRVVSPQNILIGIDGISRLTDFGIAKSELLEGAGTKIG